MNPFIQMVTKLKNASHAKKELVKLPFSNMNARVADLLCSEGWLESVARKGRGPKRYLEIKLKYEGGRPRFTEMRLISKPSRRLYKKANEIRSVRRGYGMSVVSTSVGVLPDREARKRNVGGELLMELY